MKKCPYCNSDPEVVSKTNMLRTKCESKAKGIKLVYQRKSERTGKIVSNVYEQTSYIIRCSNKKCLAYHLNKRFWSEEDAYAMWDRRA